MGESSCAASLARAVVAAALAVALAGCAQAPLKPSTAHIGADQIPARPEGAIPAPVQVVPALPPPSPTVRPETYSVVVNNVRVQDLLFALARDAKVNVDIHPAVSGFVTLNAIDQTLQQLLSRISKMIDIRWEIDGNTLLVLPDRPFVRIYTVDYLNAVRTVKTTVTASGEIAGGPPGGASAPASRTTIDISSKNNFWEMLVRNVRDLVVEEDKLRIVSEISRQAGTATAANVIAQGSGQAAATTGGALVGPGAVGAGDQQLKAQAATASTAATQTARADLASNIFDNPDAGILMVRTTARVHEKVQEYLDKLLVRSNLQVLIEATIAEVQLNNQYQQGIDWSILRRGAFGFNLIQSVTGTSPAGVNSSIFVGDYASQRFNATLKLLESFGTVRVLSSPKISVLNNQTAILKVTDNRVYFTITGTTTPATPTTAATSTFTTTPNTVAIGFTMNVTPQISASDTVILNLKPLVTRIVGFVNDPNPELARVGVVSRIPEVQTREIESIIRINSGQIAVMGGLIQDSNSDVEDGIPGLSSIPGVGSLLNHRNRENRKTELVIFIRPSVIRDASIDGDYARFRDLLPGSDYFLKPNPGREPPAQ